jgi:hypothetical protein
VEFGRLQEAQAPELVEFSSRQVMGDYYSDANVRARIVEFLGGTSLAGASCHYLTTGDASDFQHRRPLPVGDLIELFDRNVDICRSLWDRLSLIADLDIEYVNFDHPAEAFLEPERIFDMQAPVERVVEKLLLKFGIVPLHCLSGRGHHFVWRVRQDSATFAWLARLGHVPSSLWEMSARPHAPNGEAVSPSLAAAFAGLGLVMEYLAHRVKELAAGRSGVPVELTAVEVGGGHRGREMISVDVSEYGDPLHSRVMRVPFTFYLKPQYQSWQIGEELLRKLPGIFCIPLHEMSWREGIVAMRDPLMTSELAARASVGIPEFSEAMGNLVAEYEASTLAAFHAWFYSVEHHPPEQWLETYDRTPMNILPACVRTPLLDPNDLLLRPSSIRLITRVMLALGWHPRHIAGLIRSRFERDYGWGSQWLDADPATRADFYTRLFAGLFATGRDDLVDFNCQSTKEQRICPAAECSANLELFRQSALARRRYDHLAHRPFNGLFLPEEHH